MLRAADDPTDHLRIVSALRTPLLGCGDDDLFRHKVLEDRPWSYNTPTPPDPESFGVPIHRTAPRNTSHCPNTTLYRSRSE